MIAAIMNVSTSETGMEYRTPSNPKKIGSRRAKPTPKTDLPDQRDQGRRKGLTEGLKIDKGPFVDSSQDHHAKVNPEGPNSKFRIIDTFVCGSEDTDEFFRHQFHNQERYEADQSFCL